MQMIFVIFIRLWLQPQAMQLKLALWPLFWAISHLVTTKSLLFICYFVVVINDIVALFQNFIKTQVLGFN